MAEVEITLVKSLINKPLRQVKTAYALGLKKVNGKVTHNCTPQILGMLKKINHLVKIENK